MTPVPGTDRSNATSPMPGTTLGDGYRIEREVGRGGMATVWLAEDRKHARQVAVKVLLPELGASIGAERFLREIRLIARLQHPHILPLYDSGDADGLLYFVMPYIEGESLRDRPTREHALSLAEGARTVRQIADALDYAHAKGVIHRDAPLCRRGGARRPPASRRGRRAGVITSRTSGLRPSGTRAPSGRASRGAR